MRADCYLQRNSRFLFVTCFISKCHLVFGHFWFPANAGHGTPLVSSTTLNGEDSRVLVTRAGTRLTNPQRFDNALVVVETLLSLMTALYPCQCVV